METIVKKGVVSIIIIGTIITAPLLNSENNEQEKFNPMEVEKIILQKSDLPGYSLKYQDKRFFVSQTGIAQSFISPTGEEIYVRYTAFNSLEEALKGAKYHLANIAPVFQEGSFTGVKIGDKSWVPVPKNRVWDSSILFVKSNFLVLLGILPHNAKEIEIDENEKAVENIAQIIIKKIEK